MTDKTRCPKLFKLKTWHPKDLTSTQSNCPLKDMVNIISANQVLWILLDKEAKQLSM